VTEKSKLYEPGGTPKLLSMQVPIVHYFCGHAPLILYCLFFIIACILIGAATFSIMTLSLITERCYAELRYTQCRGAFLLRLPKKLLDGVIYPLH
jgi:hypothetical protein